MKIVVHLQHASHPAPLIRQVDIAFHMEMLDELEDWQAFIAKQTMTELPDGYIGIHLHDLKRYCNLKGITLEIAKAMPPDKARAFAIANCRLSGLKVTPYMLELLDKVSSGEISTNEAVNRLPNFDERY